MANSPQTPHKSEKEDSVKEPIKLDLQLLVNEPACSSYKRPSITFTWKLGWRSVVVVATAQFLLNSFPHLWLLCSSFACQLGHETRTVPRNCAQRLRTVKIRFAESQFPSFPTSNKCPSSHFSRIHPPVPDSLPASADPDLPRRLLLHHRRAHRGAVHLRLRPLLQDPLQRQGLDVHRPRLPLRRHLRIAQILRVWDLGRCTWLAPPLENPPRSITCYCTETGLGGQSLANCGLAAERRQVPTWEPRREILALEEAQGNQPSKLRDLLYLESRARTYSLVDRDWRYVFGEGESTNEILLPLLRISRYRVVLGYLKICMHPEGVWRIQSS